MFSLCHFIFLSSGRSRQSRTATAEASDLQSGGLTYAQHSQSKKATKSKTGWLRCRYIGSFYGEATLVSGSFARAWMLEYLTCSGLAQVPSTGAKIPLSHELVLMPWAFDVCVMCLEEVIVSLSVLEIGCEGKI